MRTQFNGVNHSPNPKSNFTLQNISISIYFWGGDGSSLPSHFSPQRIREPLGRSCLNCSPPSSVLIGWIRFWSRSIRVSNRVISPTTPGQKSMFIFTLSYSTFLSRGYLHLNYPASDIQTLLHLFYDVSLTTWKQHLALSGDKDQCWCVTHRISEPVNLKVRITFFFQVIIKTLVIS